MPVVVCEEMTMKDSFLLTFLELGILLILAASSVSAADPRPGFQFGLQEGGQVFTCTFYEGNDPKRVGNVMLWKANGGDQPQVSRYHVPVIVTDTYTKYPLRWRVSRDFYWIISVLEFAPRQRAVQLERIPWAGMDAYLAGASGKPTTPAPGDQKNANRSSAPEDCGALEPLADSLLKMDLNQAKSVYYDLWPVAADRCSFYILSDRSMTVWDYQFQYTKSKGVSKAEWQKKETFPVNWAEPFYVHAAGTSLFFVTESGKLYQAKPSKDGSRKVEELWTRPRQPLLALVVDAKSSQAFAFGKDFFFEVKDEVRPSPCADVTSGSAKVEKPLRILLQCAAVLKKSD
jgi:hypothetical protein